MNNKLRDEIRNWKPTRAQSQLYIPDLLHKKLAVFVSITGMWEVAKPNLAHRWAQYRLVYTVDTLKEADDLRDLLCFQTESGRWRLYWVRRTGLHSAWGPAFSTDHFSWITSHIHRCWVRYVNPARRRQPA